MLIEFKANVELLAAPVIEQLGLELVEVSVVQRQGTYAIEILIDLPQGGIGLEQCALANQKLAQVFDTQPWVNDYELVVASPGLDRPLKTARDFRRNIDCEVRVVLTERVDGKGEYSGLVKEVGTGEVVIALKAKSVRIPFEKIMKAVLII